MCVPYRPKRSIFLFKVLLTVGDIWKAPFGVPAAFFCLFLGLKNGVLRVCPEFEFHIWGKRQRETELKSGSFALSPKPGYKKPFPSVVYSGQMPVSGVFPLLLIISPTWD